MSGSLPWLLDFHDRFQIPSNHPSVHVPGKAVVGEVEEVEEAEVSQLD